MRFSVQLPTQRVDLPEEFLSAQAIAEMARAAESAGFDACYVTDHPFPDARWLRAGGHHALDPFVALAFAAAATTTLRLHTNALVLAYRNPFLSAKAAASLDALSGGRLILGVAAGYLEGEFAALGADLAERNELTDEAIGAIRRAWGEDDVILRGRHFEARGNVMRPRPAQRPHPPVWVGGNSRRAIRRAVELGDGWMPFPNPAKLAPHLRSAALESNDDLAARLAYAREHAEKIGREAPLDVCFVPLALGMLVRQELAAARFLEEVATLEALGVTWLAIALPCASRREYAEQAARFGAEVIAGLA